MKSAPTGRGGRDRRHWQLELRGSFRSDLGPEFVRRSGPIRPPRSCSIPTSSRVAPRGPPYTPKQLIS